MQRRFHTVQQISTIANSSESKDDMPLASRLRNMSQILRNASHLRRLLIVSGGLKLENFSKLATINTLGNNMLYSIFYCR